LFGITFFIINFSKMMRAVYGALLLGAAAYADGESSSVCAAATDEPGCNALHLEQGLNCMWSSLESRCGHPHEIWVGYLGGTPIATMRGTQNTYHTTDGHAIHFMTVEDHEFMDEVVYGKFQTYIRSDEVGRPTAMGFSLPVDLDSIFQYNGRFDTGGRFLFTDEHRCNSAFPFTHVQFNFIAGGHPGGFDLADLFKAFGQGPEAVNTVIGSSTWFQRHFDVHFHLDEPEESNNIMCSLGNFPPCKGTPEEMARFEDVPSPEFLPAGFEPDPIAHVPFMGSHWVVAEGQSYDSFHDDYAQVFGTYAGRTTFWEGMVTKSSLEQLTPQSPKEYDYVVPEKVFKSGYYPTKIRFHRGAPHGLRVEDAEGLEDTYSIEFYDMEWRLGEDDVAEARETGSQLPTEDKMCPALDCSGEVSSQMIPYCSQCGTRGVKVAGRKTGGRKRFKTSCQCQAFCQYKSEGYSFKLSARQERKNKKGKCVCLNNLRLSKAAWDRKYTSHRYHGEEREL